MTRFLCLCICVFLLTNCKTTKTPVVTNDSTPERYNRSNNLSRNNSSTDSITVTGIQYIPLYGKRESGVNPDIEGAWVLETMDGVAIKSDAGKKLDSIAKSKLIIERRNDTIIYKVKDNGADRIITEILSQKPDKDRSGITPQQSSMYHLPETPTINFFGSNETFSGFTGCNRYSGRYEMTDSNSISLKNATPSTRMVCLGDFDEDSFIEHLHRVNKFKGTERTLELIEGDKVILTFTRKPETR